MNDRPIASGVIAGLIVASIIACIVSYFDPSTEISKTVKLFLFGDGSSELIIAESITSTIDENYEYLITNDKIKLSNLESVLEDKLKKSSYLGNLKAQILFVMYTCEGAYGFDQSPVDALEKQSEFERHHNFTGPNTPFSGLCNPL